MTQEKRLTVNCYLSSLPLNINSEEKTRAINLFAAGVSLAGDTSNIVKGYDQIVDSDIGVIIGNAFNSNPKKVLLPHYKIREKVINFYQAPTRHWVSIDSNIFIYKNKENPKKYLRYSFDGVFPATGIYCNDAPGEDNWNNIKRDYNMDLKPWRSNGNHILIALQRPLGWSMRGYNLMNWLEETFTKIRKYSDRPIIIRWHPGDWKSYPNYAHILTKDNATVSPQTRHITEDLVNCWALICHNSTPSAVAPIEGIPAFITDDPSYSQGGDIANTDFSRLEDPILADREQWIKKLAQCHWNFEDLRSGRCWAHMRNWVK